MSFHHHIFSSFNFFSNSFLMISCTDKRVTNFKVPTEFCSSDITFLFFVEGYGFEALNPWWVMKIFALNLLVILKGVLYNYSTLRHMEATKHV